MANGNREEIMRLLACIVGSFVLFEDVVIGWDTQNRRILTFFFLQEKTIKDEELREMIHARIIALGRRTLEMQSPGYSSPTCSHHALAYAVHHKVFNEEEIRRIRCDDAPSLEKFVERYRPDQFFGKVLRQLLEEKEPTQFELFEANGLPAELPPGLKSS